MEKTLKFEAAIFDMDGVITRTALVHGTAWKKMFDDYLKFREDRDGEVFNEFTQQHDYQAYVDGRPRYKGVEAFLTSRNIHIPEGTPDDDIDTETVCGLGNKKNYWFNQIIESEGVDVYASSVDLINDLLAHNIKVALATSSKNCTTVLKKTGLTDLFEVCIDGVVSSAVKLKGKPHPDIFTTACDALNVSYHKAIVFEDAISGVQAGKRGNFGLVVGVARDMAKDDLLKNGADIAVGDLEELDLEKMNHYYLEAITANHP